MDLLQYSNFHERLAAAELARIVKEYDLRWDGDPARRYPVTEVGWCPSGWMPLVEALVVRLVALGWNRRLAQVKVEFGALTFFIGPGSTRVHATISRAERRSLRICDVCGAPGRQRQRNGTAVRCVKHRPRDGERSPVEWVGSFWVREPGRRRA